MQTKQQVSEWIYPMQAVTVRELKNIVCIKFLLLQTDINSDIILHLRGFSQSTEIWES